MSCYKFPLVVLATQNVRSIFPSIWMYPMHIHYQSTPAWNQQKYNFVQSKSRIDVCWPLLNGFYPTIFAATCCRNRQVQSCITIMTHITSPTQPHHKPPPPPTWHELYRGEEHVSSDRISNKNHLVSSVYNKSANG